MATDELRVCDNASPGDWIRPRLTGESGTVTGTVPSGYEAYVRVCHPAADRDGTRATWAEVASTTGRQVHPLMQWHALVGTADWLNMRGSLWRGDNPLRGELEPQTLEPLCRLLSAFTSEPRRCYFCLWEGWGWLEGGSEVTIAWHRDAEPPTADELRPPPPAFSAEELSRPRVKLPQGRNYILMEGPLSAATRVGHWATSAWFIPQSPNLFWSEDRAWCVASEIDFDSTLVGASSGLIDAILASPALDAWPIGPRDSLTADADHINDVQSGRGSAL